MPLKGITIESEYLDVNKYRTANVDSYECLADNGVGEPLRKSIKVSFMGKFFSKSSLFNDKHHLNLFII